jgi:hypothetical protein
LEFGTLKDLLQGYLSVVLKAATSYFLLVFGAGFILGPIRVLYIVPRFGVRTAELMEAPLMLIVIVLSARWVVRKFKVAQVGTLRVAVGLFALLLGLLFEFVLVLKLRGLSLSEYFRERDPVAGAVYYLMLCVLALMPLLVGRKRRLGAGM